MSMTMVELNRTIRSRFSVVVNHMNAHFIVTLWMNKNDKAWLILESQMVNALRCLALLAQYGVRMILRVFLTNVPFATEVAPNVPI